MYLKELTINGFKSFAKKSELEFSVPITAIVGPNGSGKSNVAESFRFVLGEQSVKSMRGKRGEDLIWGGSEKVSRANRANVALVFDNRQRTFSLDFDEVKVERIVHRDGQNEYRVNDSPVRLKDVHELLASANIGSTGHHIISQGEADRVLSAGPKERREMIEDALGLKVYQLKKQETQRKLEKTHDNIAQVESLRREAAPHLKYLKKQVEKAERSLEIQKELQGKYTEYLKREDVYVAHHHDRLIAERREPTARLEVVKQAVQEAKRIVAESTESEAENEQQTAAEATLAERSKARLAAERRVGQLEGQLTLIERRIDRAANQRRTGATVLPREQVERVVTAIEAIVEKALGRSDTNSLERALNDVVHQLRTFLQKERGEVIDTTEADTAERDELHEKLLAARTELEAAQGAETEAQGELEKVRSEQKEGSERSRTAERELFALLNEQRELEATLNRIDRELAHLERDRQDFKAQLQEAVALLGRAAADYYEHKITTDAGEPIAEADVVVEPRECQRERAHELEKLKIRLEELGVGATEGLMKEYQEAKERDDFLARELEDLGASVENLSSLITEMEEKLQEQFSAGVDRITKEFNTFFTLMFGGGAATLKRAALKRMTEDEEEVTVDGVELDVHLPNKRVKGLEMLSGGERALTSIALIFAMSQVNPPPFIILDETDAALDEANSRRYGDMIEALAKKSQLVLITHNRETMSRAGILYGITMGGDGVSKVLSVKFDEAAVVAK